MPVEGSISHRPGIEMCGRSLPAGTVGGDLYEYINFQQRCDDNARTHLTTQLFGTAESFAAGFRDNFE